jgi:hypothetical protein
MSRRRSQAPRAAKSRQADSQMPQKAVSDSPPANSSEAVRTSAVRSLNEELAELEEGWNAL